MEESYKRSNRYVLENKLFIKKRLPNHKRWVTLFILTGKPLFYFLNFTVVFCAFGCRMEII